MTATEARRAAMSMETLDSDTPEYTSLKDGIIPLHCSKATIKGDVYMFCNEKKCHCGVGQKFDNGEMGCNTYDFLKKMNEERIHMQMKY